MRDFKYSYKDMFDCLEEHAFENKLGDMEYTEIRMTQKYKVLNKKQQRALQERAEKQMGLKDLGYREYFVKDNIKRIGKLEMPKDYPDYRFVFPKGLYYMSYLDQMYIVFPRLKKLADGSEALIADHFTYMKNTNTKKQVQFHRTVYLPSDTHSSHGLTVHQPCHFADGQELPVMAYDTDVFDALGEKKHEGLDVTRLYVRAYGCRDASRGGGLKRAPKPKKTMRRRDVNRGKRAVPGQLEAALLYHRIKGVGITSIKRDDGLYDITVIFTWPEDTAEKYKHIDVCLSGISSKAFGLVSKKMVKHLKDLHRRYRGFTPGTLD